MRIRYWNYNSRQMQPREFIHSQLIKPKGLIHSNSSFRRIVGLCEQHSNHEFLVSCIDSRILYGLPENVNPILHVESNRDITNNLENYLSYCNSDGHLPIFSVLAQGNIDVTTITKECGEGWFFISSNHYVPMRRVLTDLQHSRQIVYCEYYMGSRLIDSMPKAFRRRQLPKVLVNKVVVRDLINLLDRSEVLETA